MSVSRGIAKNKYNMVISRENAANTYIDVGTKFSYSDDPSTVFVVDESTGNCEFCDLYSVCVENHSTVPKCTFDEREDNLSVTFKRL